MPIGFQTENWTEEELEIFVLFRFRCVRCRTRAVTLHEICPKSRCPKNWQEKENRVPVCNNCHEWAHRRGTKYSAPILRNLRVKRLNEQNKTF